MTASTRLAATRAVGGQRHVAPLEPAHVLRPEQEHLAAIAAPARHVPGLAPQLLGGLARRWITCGAIHLGGGEGELAVGSRGRATPQAGEGRNHWSTIASTSTATPAA